MMKITEDFKKCSIAVKRELLQGSYDRIMVYTTELVISRLEEKFKTKILVIPADDEITKRKKREKRRKYYIIKVEEKKS